MLITATQISPRPTWRVLRLTSTAKSEAQWTIEKYKTQRKSHSTAKVSILNWLSKLKTERTLCWILIKHLVYSRIPQSPSVHHQNTKQRSISRVRLIRFLVEAPTLTRSSSSSRKHLHTLIISRRWVTKTPSCSGLLQNKTPNINKIKMIERNCIEPLLLIERQISMQHLKDLSRETRSKTTRIATIWSGNHPSRLIGTHKHPKTNRWFNQIKIDQKKLNSIIILKIKRQIATKQGPILHVRARKDVWTSLETGWSSCASALFSRRVHLRFQAGTTLIITRKVSLLQLRSRFLSLFFW